MAHNRWRTVFNQISPAIPYAFLYDVNGVQVFDNAGAFHVWDTAKILSQHFTFTSDTDRVYLNVNSSGFYKITFECSYNGIDGGAANSTIYKNGAALDGCTVSTYCTGNEQGSQTLTATVFLNQNDYIQIWTIASANSVSSIADTSRLIIEFIPMRGWDNSKGGRADYKGEVMR